MGLLFVPPFHLPGKHFVTHPSQDSFLWLALSATVKQYNEVPTNIPGFVGAEDRLQVQGPGDVLSMAFCTWFGETPGRGSREISEVQSTSLMRGYAAEESLPAAPSVAPSLLLSAAGVEGATGDMV